MKRSSHPFLEGRRVFLTALHFDNIRTHYRWNNDPDLHHLDSEGAFESEAFGSFARRFEQMIPNDDVRGYDFEIHGRTNGASRLIGVAYLASLDSTHRRGQVGVTIGDRAWWGRGYGRETLELLLAFGFGELDLHRITANAFAYNAAWKGLLAAAGFRLEGRLRDYLYRRQRFWDKELYALLTSEYAARQARAA
jgi:RimJ/RimL family protein N-acetyltransferase